MKRAFLSLCLVTSAIFAAQFAPTPQTYGAYEDFEGICKAFFGNKAKVATWQEIKEAYRNSKDKKDLLQKLGLQKYDQSYIINYKDGYFEDGDRHYILTYHDGHLPTNYTYLVHDTIDDHVLDLGSWNDIDYPVLCKIR